MAKQFDEPVDARIPESFVGAEPTVGPLERPRVDAAVVDASTDGALHESGPLEGLDVLRRRGEGHPVRCRELANGLLPFGEPFEHRTPGVVAERTEHEIELRLMLFNHTVEHTDSPLIVNQFVEC